MYVRLKGLPRNNESLTSKGNKVKLHFSKKTRT